MILSPFDLSKKSNKRSHDGIAQLNYLNLDVLSNKVQVLIYLIFWNSYTCFEECEQWMWSQRLPFCIPTNEILEINFPRNKPKRKPSNAYGPHEDGQLRRFLVVDPYVQPTSKYRYRVRSNCCRVASLLDDTASRNDDKSLDINLIQNLTLTFTLTQLLTQFLTLYLTSAIILTLINFTPTPALIQTLNRIRSYPWL